MAPSTIRVSLTAVRYVLGNREFICLEKSGSCIFRSGHFQSCQTRIVANHGNNNGWIVLDQIRTIDKQRIIKILDKLTDKEIKLVKEIIKETFVD